MLMPIVSMNKMAMNESVAATCCYRQVASPTNVYWEVLNGGWIGSGYVDVRARKSESLKAWEVFNFDLKGWLNTDGSINAAPAVSTVVNPDGTTTYGVVWGGSVITLDAFFTPSVSGQSTFTRGGYCDHKVTGTNVCAYYDQSPQYKSNYHFEAKSKHAELSSWATPHAANPFNS